jgi:16S rRNA (guanine1207-N2)-methyltransferase
MSRWADDPQAAADALIARSLSALELSGRVLLANAGAGAAKLMAARGVSFTPWSRRAAAGTTAAPWPPAGPFGLALVRLAKAKDEQEMTVHAVLGVLAAGGRLVLYGGNDEGIRSAAGMLQGLCGGLETIAARGHGRVVMARRPERVAGLRVSLVDWRMLAPLELAGRRRDWVSYPGLFAAGRLDEGTALLVGALPPLASGARVLDYACGSGAVGASALATQPGIRLDMLDDDTVALEAARENVPAARPVLGMRIADAGSAPYDVILSNPPLHAGVAEDHTLLERLVADAPARLAAGGMLQVVVQRRIALERLLATHLADVRVAAENGRYRVWSARRA